MARKPTIYFIEIQLRYAKIPVWRILEVKRTTTLHDLHLSIQVAMGWEAEHLYEFRIDEKVYCLPDEDEPIGLRVVSNYEDSNKYRLMDLDLKTDDSFSYLYDFGDGWEVDVIIRSLAKEWHYLDKLPICRTGAMAGPPENIGGIPAFNALQDYHIHKTPIEINPYLEEAFKNWDPFDADVPGWYSFSDRVRNLRRKYRR